MSALGQFLERIQDTNKARIENVDSKQVLYLIVTEFRKHMSEVACLVSYQTEVDYIILVNHGKEVAELHPPQKK